MTLEQSIQLGAQACDLRPRKERGQLFRVPKVQWGTWRWFARRRRISKAGLLDYGQEPRAA